MANRDLVVIGGSAGGIEALQQVLGALPKDLDAAVLIVLHTSNHAGSLLPQIMQRASRLPAIHPRDRTRIEKGTIYIAPPDCHMIVEGDFLRVIQGLRETFTARQSIRFFVRLPPAAGAGSSASFSQVLSTMEPQA